MSSILSADSIDESLVQCAGDGQPNSSKSHSIPSGQPFHIHDTQFYCQEHFDLLMLPSCTACNEPLKGDFIKLTSKTNNTVHYHTQCWKCNKCSAILTANTAASDSICKSCDATAAGISATDSAAASAAESKASEALARLAAKKSAAAAANTNSNNTTIIPPESSPSYTLIELQKSNKKPIQSIDISKREYYLSDTEFQSLFKQSKAEFSKLPKWKQDNAKKQFDLF